ncbi:MAG: ribulose-phosphate 3-epimerase [Acidimicrobiia bacterium]|nr:ribulose-phosphate 3-epimerase [Acidimicrobiia bacterium]MDX2467293.1 ribulose-phosphate 3-epimerase [Acidimicrobiia bacterium]
MKTSSLIAPSILAADFARLGEEVNAVAPFIDMIHIDVMDGHFVPNISLGIPVIESLRAVTDVKFDCHLMMLNPDFYFDALRQAGADMVSVHLEVFPNPTEVAAQARSAGLEFGLAVNPPTSFEALEPYIELCDMVVVMAVHPGFGGQSFIPESLKKVESVRNLVESHDLLTDIEVDGGIGPANIKRAYDAGANVFVAGSSVFGTGDSVEAVKQLRTAIENREEA